MRNWGLGKQCRRRPKSDAMSMLYVLFVGDTFPVVDGGRVAVVVVLVRVCREDGSS